MAFMSVSEALRDEAGARVTVKGWVRTRRDSKAGLSFIALSDGSCFDTLQIVAPASLANYEGEVQRLTTGCAIEADGELTPSAGKGQAIEMQASAVRVVGWVDDPDTYPVAAKRHTFEYLREIAHLRPRTNTIAAVARVRNCLAQAIHRFFHEQGFAWIHTPIITASDCEGAGQMFRVSTLDATNPPRDERGGVDFSQDFFGREAHLTVSGQLNVECYCLALSKVYTFGPTFRAENSNTSRHLAEFWMVEPEVAFADLSANADLAEAFLKHCFRALLQERPDDMAFFNERIDPSVLATLEHMIETPFERVTYTEAIRLLEESKEKFEFPVAWGADMQSEHERYLTETTFKKPVVVTCSTAGSPRRACPRRTTGGTATSGGTGRSRTPGSGLVSSVWCSSARV